MPATMEMESLNPVDRDEKFASKPSSSKFSLKFLVVLIGFGIGILYLVSGAFSNRAASTSTTSATAATSKHHEIHQTIHNINKTAQILEHWTQKFAAARTEFDDTMRLQYGEFYEPIFFEDQGNGKRRSRGKTVFVSGKVSSTESWDRFRRKVMMKLLRIIRATPNFKLSPPLSEGPTQPFVWATGGHSSTAGHGNFFHESYTAVLDRAARPVMAAVQLDFAARNYAMGGTAAAPEIALCAREIFGSNLDVLVWDYGMTDGAQVWKQALYHWRASLLTTKTTTETNDKSNQEARPLHIAYHAGGRSYRNRQSVMREMEERGLAALISSESVTDAALAAVPDSFGKSVVELDAMPDYVRNFRCQKQIESGDPFCKTDKYNLTMCADRKFQANWHPGWKWHAIMGYLAALFLIDIVEDALEELMKRALEDSSEVLSELQAAEDVEYETFQHAPIPDGFKDVLPPNGVDGFDVARIINGPSFCHTARLPAEIRYKGILTESTLVGFSTYDVGMGLETAKKTPLENELMDLVYTEADRQTCPISTNVDYKDYFYVSNFEDSWKKLVLPNNAEVKEYRSDQILHGHIAMCFTLCPWGKCPAGVLDVKAFPEKLDIQVNGKAVTDLREFEECVFLKHADGYQWTANAEQKFDVRVRVTNEAALGSYVRLSAVILW